MSTKKNARGKTEAGGSSSKPLKSRYEGRCKSIAIYNYKGGVGKTLLTRELAACLSKAGKNVGVIDCDPQCNLTTFWEQEVDPEVVQGQAEEEPEIQVANSDAGNISNFGHILKYELNEKAIRHFEANTEPMIVGDEEKDNLFTILNPLFVPQDEFDYKKVKLPVFEIKLKPRHFGKIVLIRGSDRIVEYEKDLEPAAGGSAHSRYVGNFRAVIEKFAGQEKLDYVLLDCSPSSGILNKILCMTANYILPPAFADLGNLHSLHRMLNKVIPTWLKDRKELVEKQRRFNVTNYYKLPENPPKLLPVVMNNLALYQNRSVTEAASLWVIRVKRLFEADPSSNYGLPIEIQNILHPGGNGEQMVWELLPKLFNILVFAENWKYPLSWWADDADYDEFVRMKEDDPLFDAQVEKKIRSARNKRKNGTGMVQAWKDKLMSVVTFLETLPSVEIHDCWKGLHNNSTTTKRRRGE